MTYRAHRAARGAYATPALFALILALGLLLTGCDTAGASDDLAATGQAATDGATADAVLAGAVAGVASDAGASSDDLAAATRPFEGRPLEPGVLWAVAAEVHGRLTDEQLARLATRLDERRTEMQERRAARGDRPHGPRGRFGGAGFRGAPLLDRVLTGDLVLTDAQAASIEALRETYRPEFEALRASDLADDERRAQARALAEALRAEIDAVLTDAQRAALDAHRAERTERRDERRAAEQAAMATALALTEQQQADLEALRAELEAQRGTVAPHEAHDAFRAAFAEILDDTQEEIVTVHRALQMHLVATAGPRGGRGGAGHHRPHGGFGGPRG